MTKPFLFAFLAVSLLSWSCSKNVSDELLENDLAKVAATPGVADGHRTPIVQNGSGDYICNFLGGTLNFGSSFVYPTTALPLGTPYIPMLIAPVHGTNNMLEFNIHSDGHNFSILYGTYQSPKPPGAFQVINKYFKALDDHFAAKRDSTGQLIEPTMPNLHLISQNHGILLDHIFLPSNGILTITGSFAHDPNSPTNISLMGIISAGGGAPPLVE